VNESPDQFLRKPAMVMLALGITAAVAATALHRYQTDPHFIDLVVPPAVAVLLTVMLFMIGRHPDRLRSTMTAGFLAVLGAMLIPVWYFSFEAFRDPAIRLVDTLPPVTAVLFPMTIALSLFLRQRVAIPFAAAAWITVAAPVLGYMAFHPAELLTPRGRDIVMTLGPMMAIAVGLIPVHARLQRRVALLQLQKRDLKDRAERDGMTGLYNRQAGEEALVLLLDSITPRAALILFDVDHFKNVNDSLGHAVGDEVLREIVRRCSERVRQNDRFIRWGGEEFLIIADGVGEDGAHSIAEVLRALISETPIADAGTVTASFGVAVPVEGDDPASLMQRADQALYAAKAGGRNCVV
jgi:diguanylate cyclase (GGDEF)-like protein